MLNCFDKDLEVEIVLVEQIEMQLVERLMLLLLVVVVLASQMLN